MSLTGGVNGPRVDTDGSVAPSAMVLSSGDILGDNPVVGGVKEVRKFGALILPSRLRRSPSRSTKLEPGEGMGLRPRREKVSSRFMAEDWFS